MEKLDRLVWAEGSCFVAHGVRIGVRVSDPAAWEHLQGRYPPGWRPTDSPVVDRIYSIILGGTEAGSSVRRYHLWYAGINRLARTRDLEEALAAFQDDVETCVVAMAPRRVFVHAGAVGWRGRAILIPGRSFSGKSALVAALVRAGATYYSDEFAGLDHRGRVHPYPRPLSLREDGSEEKRFIAPEDLGGRTGAKPLPVGLVMATHYRAGARWRPSLLSPGRGLMELLAWVVPARIRPPVVLATLKQVAVSAPTLKGVRGEADAAAAAILAKADAFWGDLSPRNEASGLPLVLSRRAKPAPSPTEEKQGAREDTSGVALAHNGRNGAAPPPQTLRFPQGDRRGPVRATPSLKSERGPLREE